MTAPVVAVRVTGLGQMEVPGLPCGVPGLAITRAVDNPSVLVITHVRSGCGVAAFRHGDPEAALACALDLAGVADWDAPAGELRAAVTAAEPLIARRGGFRDRRAMAVVDELEDIAPATGGGS